jgi:DNA-directed RNA polymerase specialized sigma24 family protein
MLDIPLGAVGFRRPSRAGSHRALAAAPATPEEEFFLARALGDRRDAEEVTQDVLMTVVGKVGTFKDEAALHEWRTLLPLPRS